uniref:centrosomal protein 43 isoform X4 n=1 Tax=Panthera onca TaxID=9690 RepID=UPI0029535052|nr:centrosomal protein 43 isoform X4 [Panthera onca]
MAATAAAVVPEEDTELRDLLVQTLENSGVLNRIKAELRAAVFLALEEQEKVENKTPLVNESLRKFLNTRDGRLVAGLVAEFLQFFNLDFTLAVFQPETSTFQGLDGRENLARDLGIIEAEGTVGGPLLLEVIRRCQQKEKGSTSGEGALDLSDVHSPPKSPDGKTSAHSSPSKEERARAARGKPRLALGRAPLEERPQLPDRSPRSPRSPLVRRGRK